MDCDRLTLIIWLCCTGVGRTGWHIDGSFMAKPFAYSTYHIVSCPTQAGTSLALYYFSPAAHHIIPYLLHIILSVDDTTFDAIA